MNVEGKMSDFEEVLKKAKSPIVESDGEIEYVSSIDVECIRTLYREWYGINIDQFLSTESGLHLLRCLKSGVLFFWPLCCGNNEYYSVLGESSGYYYLDKYEFSYAQKFVKPEDKILDVGCGLGYFSSYLPQSIYVGLEISDYCIDYAQSKGIDVRKESIESFCEKHEEHFDVVTSFQVLEHVEDPVGFLKSCKKVLKKDGLLVVSTPNDSGIWGLLSNDLLNAPPHHVTRWSEESLIYIFNIFL